MKKVIAIFVRARNPMGIMALFPIGQAE